MNSIYSPNDKLGRAATFMEYLASLVSLIFLLNTLMWNKITFWLSNSLNPAELVVNEIPKSRSKKFTNIPFSIHSIDGLLRRYQEHITKEQENVSKILISIAFY